MWSIYIAFLDTWRHPSKILARAEFELFDIRISDQIQIQIVKMAVGRHLKFYSNIVSSHPAKVPYSLARKG
jgi:hypothetical protein